MAFGSQIIDGKKMPVVTDKKDTPPWLQKLGDPKTLHFKKVKRELFNQYKLIRKEGHTFEKEKLLIDQKESEFTRFILENKDLMLAKELLKKNSGWTFSNVFTGTIATLAVSPILLSVFSVVLNLGAGLPNLSEFGKDPIGYTKRYVKEVVVETEERLNGPQGESHKATLKQQNKEQKQEKIIPQDKKKKHR